MAGELNNNTIINEDDRVINDEFGISPWYNVGSYDGLAKRKGMMNNDEFLSDMEVYDGATHTASSISLVSATGINKIDENGELKIIIEPNPTVANVPTNAIWESNNSSVAYVLSDGTVVARSLGEATITATDPDNNLTANFRVYVVEDAITAQQEENTEEISNTLSENGGGDVVITAGNVKDIEVPADVTKTSKITAPLAENATVTSEGNKLVYINNTSETPSNLDITAGASTVYLTGEYGTVTTNTSVKVSDGEVSNVSLSEETGKAVTVNAVFNPKTENVVYNPTENNLTITNGNEDAGKDNPDVIIRSEDSTVTMNSSWGTVTTYSGDNTLYLNNSTKIKKLIVKKGNVIVKDTTVENHIEQIVNDTEYTVSPNIMEASNWSTFKSSATTAGITNLTGNIESTSNVSFGIFANGNYIWNIGDYSLRCGTSSGSCFLIRGSVNLDINASENGVIENSNNSYGLWVSSNTAVVNVNGGNWTATTHVLYAEKGTINVYGGTFKVPEGSETKYLLNCFDANFTAGTAKINVFGGKFYGFNPAESYSEPEQPYSFVPEGYESVEIEEGVWEVRPVQ